MRVVQVSAHYPPDFVSGGTLVPARLARALTDRGDEVHVFAGHLDDRVPLAEWDETVDGVPVHWIAIGRYTDWASTENFDNPQVDRAFADYLRRVRPDVVHLHALQSLGAGLVPVAKASGARVVVTMHDFWWVCARQFLVDPSRCPCSLVVGAGVCPCSVSPAWLAHRNGRLMELLAGADLVLTPSASAARVMAANGIGSDRLEVDENGLPPQPPPAAPPARRAGEPVRLMYAGGPDPMKGWPTLRQALARLTDLTGWQLDAYGIEDPAAAVADPRLRLRPRYHPEALPAVLAEHDVLVLPSLMRESFSILTREALTAGLAVVCSDTLGPEEVVSDEANGLVVAAGDVAGLSRALRRLVCEPELLARLRGGAAQPPPIRSLDEQADGLQRTYRRLLDTAPRPAAPTGLPGRVLFIVGIDGAPLRYRAHLPAEALALHGVHCDVRHYRDPQIVPLAAAADAIVCYRVPASRQVLDLIAGVRRDRPAVPFLFDVDDLIFDESIRPYVRGIAHLPPEEIELWWQGVRRYRTTMEACDLYVGSTELLCEHARTDVGMPASRFRNGVGVLLGQLSDAALRRPRTPGPLRIGYFSGTDTHDRDWAHLEPAVLTLLRRHPDLQLWLGGLLRPGPALAEFGDRVRRLPFLPWQELPAALRDLDVNLAPLEPGSPFNEAKSAIKWLEAALVATPTVASPTQPFVEAVTPGVDGALAATEAEWVEQIERLLSDEVARRRMGERARRTALLDYSPHLQGERYLQIIAEARRLVADPDRVPHPRREPEFLDEPFDDNRLAPYAAPQLAPLLHPPGRTWLPPQAVLARRYLHATVATVRERGVGAAARDTRRVLRRVSGRVVRSARNRRG